MSRRNPRQMLSIGPLSASSQAMPHFIGRQDFSDVAPTKVCNAVMPKMTQEEARRLMPPASVRPGAMDAFALPSRGEG